MKNQFVTYEIALKLKELGFDEECLAWFAENKEIQIAPNVYKKWTSKPLTNLNIIKVFNIDCITAPLWQQVIDWFREKHNIWIQIEMQYYDGITYTYTIIQNNGKVIKSKEEFHEYYEAREQAILKAIESCQNENNKN